MAETQENKVYQLGFLWRLPLAAPYLVVTAALLVVQGDKLWTSILQFSTALLFTLAAIGWIFTYQKRRLAQYCAWLPILAIPLLVTLWIATGQWIYGILLCLTPLLFIFAGLGSYLRHTAINGIPTVPGGWVLALKLAFDEAMLGYFVSASSTPGRRRILAIADEVHQAIDVMEKYGWLDNPATFHIPPEEPAAIELVEKTALGRQYQVLRFPSQYQPHEELPGAKSWMQYESTHTVRARLFEHKEEGRPWLMCIHGYRMGWTYMDFQLFSPGWLHHKLGFNLIMPLLPLHGHRKEGFRSGDGFFEGDLLNLIHAEGQAQSDLRACIQWLHKQRSASRIGVYGISLGGLNASLLSSLETGIDSVIAGIPLVSPSRVFELNAPRRLVKLFEKRGVSTDTIEKLLKPISPLEMRNPLPRSAKAIVAGSYDRIVPLEPILDLHTHWENCRMLWYPGTHLSVRREASVRDWLMSTWQAHGMLDHLQSGHNQGNLAISQ